jgi:tetratricopeptide (TPR) repeat protein
MTGHCFISYSNTDGLDFATKLATELESGQPFIKVWFDKNEMTSSGDDWDDQICSAISNCKCLLFVMSEDSTGKGSNCKEEWTWALKCKKPVICIFLDKKAEDQFRLNNRQKVDFSSNFDAGVAQLRKAVARLDSEEGKLDELNHRLADAKRDLHRAKDEDQLRIKTEIEELKAEITRQEEIVKNPKAAEKRTEDNIKSGLERERQPEKPTTKSQSTKFINPPPGIAPNYFQDRFVETRQIVDFLNNDSQRLLTIVGRAGVGKTAMVCRLLKALERGELPDDLGEMKADGIVYLSETGSHRVNFANVFADLSKLLPKDDAEQLEGIYKNPQTSTGDKMRALLDAFPSGRVILLLDNFETLIDPESLSLRDSELSDALNALLGGQHHAVKAVITTRIAPRDLAVSEPGRQHHLSLDEGLESPYAENVLREMDADGRVGLKSAPDALLNKAREKTRGYPRALEALYAILSVDRYTTLEELLELSLPDEVVQKLVGEAFNRLDPSAQKVMQALAVYNRPVSPAAIDYLLQPHLPSIDSALVLNRLVNMHFARREAGHYYLHPADKEYAFSIVPEKDLTTKDTKVTKENQVDKPEADASADAESLEKAKQAVEELKTLFAEMKQKEQNENPTENSDNKKVDFESLFKSSRSLRASRLTAFTQHDLLNRAADYFAQARKPRAEWKKLDDLAAQLAEFELRCDAGNYDTAASVLLGFDFDYLRLWGHYRLMIEMHEKLEGKINDLNLARISIGNMGQALYFTGNGKKAITNYEKAVLMAKKAKNRQAESVWLGNVGLAYANLGDVHKAIEFHEHALVIAREIGDRGGEGVDLGNLGNRYSDLGDARKAIEFYEQALVITREVGDREREGAWLGNIGNRYSDLDEARKAIEFYEQQLAIFQEIGYRQGESICIENIGYTLLSFEDYHKAVQKIEQAIQIADEISFQPMQLYGRWRLSQVYLLQNDLVNARATIEAALQYDVPQFNHNATALHGIIALRQGERETAQEAFAKSIAQADEILAKTPDYYSALDAKGLALCGAAIAADNGRRTVDDPTGTLRSGQSSMVYRQQAIEAFQKARKIAPHAGVVKSMLRLFDELVKCDEEGILKGVREVIEGKS